MTNQEFVDKINEKYNVAKELIEGNGGYSIQRGTAHPVSGYLEDLFALYIASRINKNTYQYFVDKLIAIRLNNKGRALTFKPDLAVLENNEIKEYFDVKTNLGWNRDLKQYLIEKNELIEKIKGKNGWIYSSKENVLNITFSNALQYKVVVFNGWNINSKQLNANIEFADQLENTKIFILNTWNSKTKKLLINNDVFNNLIDEPEP